MILDLLLSRWSNVLLVSSELDHAFHFLRKIFDKSRIKIREFEKRSNFFNDDRSFSFQDNFDFFEIHFDLVDSHEHFKIFNLEHRKIALVNVKLKLSLSNSLKNFENLLFVFLFQVVIQFFFYSVVRSSFSISTWHESIVISQKNCERKRILEEEEFKTQALLLKQLDCEVEIECNERIIQRAMSIMNYHKCVACERK